MIYVVKSQSYLRTPLVSILMEGEDWLVGFDEVFDDMSNDSLIEFEGFNNYPAARIRHRKVSRESLGSIKRTLASDLVQAMISFATSMRTG